VKSRELKLQVKRIPKGYNKKKKYNKIIENETRSRNIERLNEGNYETWRIHMRSALILNDLWQYVDGTVVKPTTNAEEWIKNDSKASAVMNLSITPGQLISYHIKRIITSKHRTSLRTYMSHAIR